MICHMIFHASSPGGRVSAIFSGIMLSNAAQTRNGRSQLEGGAMRLGRGSGVGLAWVWRGSGVVQNKNVSENMSANILQYLWMPIRQGSGKASAGCCPSFHPLQILQRGTRSDDPDTFATAGGAWLAWILACNFRSASRKLSIVAFTQKRFNRNRQDIGRGSPLRSKTPHVCGTNSNTMHTEISLARWLRAQGAVLLSPPAREPSGGNEHQQQLPHVGLPPQQHLCEVCASVSKQIEAKTKTPLPLQTHTSKHPGEA
jgi:hypothetical protein